MPCKIQASLGDQPTGWTQTTQGTVALLETGTGNKLELCPSSGCWDLQEIWDLLDVHTAVQTLAAPGAAAGCCALHPLWAELPAWALPCQGCQWYLSSCLQEPRRNLAFAVISVPLVSSTELGERGQPCEQTDRCGNCDFMCLAS